MNAEQILRDIATIIDGDADLNYQVNLITQYTGWKDFTTDDFLNMSDGEVLDLIYDIVKEAV